METTNKKAKIVTYQDVITTVSARTGVPKRVVQRVVNELVAVVILRVKQGCQVYLGGLGVLRRTWMAARSGVRLFATDKVVEVPGRWKVSYRLQAKLKNELEKVAPPKEVKDAEP